MNNFKILEVKNLSVNFGKEEVLKNLSFEVWTGDVLAILGPNGGGKTTLLRALLKIVPYQGEILWRPNVKIGYVPQRLPVFEHIPINILEFFNLINIDENKTRDTLEKVGILNISLNKKLNELSSGQFQRLLIGWSIAQDPDILLFDEPLSGIDIGGQETVYSLLSKLHSQKNITIIFVTHELSIVSKLANKALCLNKQMLCFNQPKEILKSDILQKLYSQEIKFYYHNH